MTKLAKITFSLLFTLLLVGTAAFAVEDDDSPLGFQFGISKKDAENIIDREGRRIVEEKEDSKKIKTIIMQGTLVDLPVDVTGMNVMTGLEFYKKKLMSTSLIVEAEDDAQQSQLEETFANYLVKMHGEPKDKESMLYFTTWHWILVDHKLVLSSNSKKKWVKVDFTYIPVDERKREDEIDARRDEEVKDPAKQMFLDADYSKPTGYLEK